MDSGVSRRITRRRDVEGRITTASARKLRAAPTLLDAALAALPDGLEDVSGYPRLLAALAERGWSDADLGALTSGNVLRVMHDAGLTDAGEGRTTADTA